MKNINKNSTWLSLTFITLLLYIIGLYAIGFKVDKTFINLETIAQAIKDGTAASYVVSTNGLFVSGLVFTAAAVSLVISKWVLDELNIKTKLPDKYWDYVFLGVVSLAAVLIISGAALFISKLATDAVLNPTSASPNSGNSAGIFILVILTIPLNIIPLFMPNKDDSSKPTVENAEVVSSEVTTDSSPSSENQN